MAEETIESLKKRLAQKEASNQADIKRLQRMERMINVLIAAGQLDHSQCEKAYELIDGLDAEQD